MEDFIMIVKIQEELPQIGKIYEVEKVISGKRCGFKVKKIKRLTWNKYNELVITVSGDYLFLNT